MEKLVKLIKPNKVPDEVYEELADPTQTLLLALKREQRSMELPVAQYKPPVWLV